MYYINNYIEISTKNFCALYFTYSGKYHANLKDLNDFYIHMSSGLREK